VGVHAIPAWEKALDFVQRDVKYRRLAREITADRRDDLGRALALFEWTRAHVRPQPPALAVVDDHIWHIVIRGYGTEDQQADVFTTLAAYAGLRAWWTLTRPPDRCEYLPLSFVRVAGRWLVFDVAHGLVFRDRAGRPATAAALAADHGLAALAAGDLVYRGIPYARYFDHFCAPAAPPLLRAEKQMPLRRLAFEARALVGLAHDPGHHAALCPRPARDCPRDPP
jgi:hypothetical protein